MCPGLAYSNRMKHDEFSEGQAQQPAGAARPVPAVDMAQNEVNFAPSADEVARRAYFSYVNQGSRHGHEVQHWLVAESELIAERNLTRVHGFHHHP